MKYLILINGELAVADSLRPADLAAIERGELLVFRVTGDTAEFAEVTHRSVEDPNNSLDEVRYDQAIDGRIYEIAGWKPAKRFVNGEVLEPAGVGDVTVFDERRTRDSLRADIRANEAIRRESLREELREEERAKLEAKQQERR